MLLTNTIIAVSSAPGGGSVRAIVRLSGEGAWGLAREVVGLPEKVEAGWYGGLAMPILHATAKMGGGAGVLLFKGPRSFTGQDVAEIHMPDSPAVVRACVAKMLEVGGDGARLATAGEFSARAFFNGKIDLTEAEGIAATINASTEGQLRAAAALREGDLHRMIAVLTDRLANVLALVEAGIDFSEEEGISFIAAEKVRATLEEMATELEELLRTAVRIDRLDSPPTVVLIGKPNVGKSSLINTLTGGERAIVSHIAGTTRDMLSATLHAAGGEVRILDVPGEEAASDEMRGKMMEARRLAILEADLVIRVIDERDDPRAAAAMTEHLPAESLVVQNKMDLVAGGEEGLWGGARPWGNVSVRTGHNIGRLREVIARVAARHETVGQGQLALNQRHRGIVQEVKEICREAAAMGADPAAFSRHPELLAADLRRGLDVLGQITGAISPDDVLGRIFSTFCIGK